MKLKSVCRNWNIWLLKLIWVSFCVTPVDVKLTQNQQMFCYTNRERLKTSPFSPSGFIMQFDGNSRKKRFVSNPLAEHYDLPLQFYGQPPLENIALSEFETFAVERLKRKTTISLD